MKPSKITAKLPRGIRATLLCAVLLVAAVTGHAQQVQAGLSANATSVGRPVQLTIKIIGARGAQLPQQLGIEGLDTMLMPGESSQIQAGMVQGRLQATFSTLYSYRIIPLKAGDYTIPAIPLKIDGKDYQTAALSLKVVGAGASPSAQAVNPTNPPNAPSQIPSANQAQASAPGQISNDKLTAGELLVPQASAYVGEVIPVETRFYFDQRFAGVTVGRVSLSSEGITATEMSKMKQREVNIGGRLFNSVSMQGAITPVKTGPLEIPAAKLQAEVIVPTGGSDDLLGSFLGQMERKVIEVPTNTAKLEVKPLPEEGKPEDFSGAIGQFSIQASASPKKAAAGDPITLKITISGRGNFDAMTAPTLINADSWKIYPPNEKFTPNPGDELGYIGQKQFEFTITAREDQTKTPVAEFSYFDPSIHKYVTLKSAAIPVDAKGGGVPAEAVAAAASPTPTPTASPAQAASTPGPDDSLVAQYAGGTFQPLLFNRTFLIANGVLGVIWLGALLAGLSRAISSSTYAKESAAHRERRRLLDRMDSTDIETPKFLGTGAEFVRARLEANGPIANLRDALENAPIRPETKSAVGSMLDKADELNYAAGNAETKLGPEERKQIVATLKEFDNELQKAR